MHAGAQAARVDPGCERPAGSAAGGRRRRPDSGAGRAQLGAGSQLTSACAGAPSLWERDHERQRARAAPTTEAATIAELPSGPWRKATIPSPRPERPTASSLISPPSPPRRGLSARRPSGSPRERRPPVDRRRRCSPRRTRRRLRGPSRSLRTIRALRNGRTESEVGAAPGRFLRRAAACRRRHTGTQAVGVRRCRCSAAPTVAGLATGDRSSTTVAPWNSPPPADSPSGRTFRKMRGPGSGEADPAGWR